MKTKNKKIFKIFQYLIILVIFSLLFVILKYQADIPFYSKIFIFVIIATMTAHFIVGSIQKTRAKNDINNKTSPLLIDKALTIFLVLTIIAFLIIQIFTGYSSFGMLGVIVILIFLCFAISILINLIRAVTSSRQ